MLGQDTNDKSDHEVEQDDTSSVDLRFLPTKALYVPDESLSVATAPSEIFRLAASKSEIERYELPVYMARMCTYVLCSMLLVALLWAAIAKVDIIAEAKGQLVPRGNVKAVQPAANGVVDSVLVSEGQRVNAGDRLILLDTTRYKEELNRQEKELEMAKTELEQAKLAKEALEQVVNHPEAVPLRKVETSNLSDILGSVYSTFTSFKEAEKDYQPRPLTGFGSGSPDIVSLRERLGQLTSEKSEREQSLRNRTKQYEAQQTAKKIELAARAHELDELRKQLAKLEDVVDKTKGQAAAYKSVYDQGAVSRVDYFTTLKNLDLDERNAIATSSQISTLERTLEMLKSSQLELSAQARAEISRQAAEIKNLAAQIATVNMQLRDNERKYQLAGAAYTSALEKAKNNLEKQIVQVADKEKRLSQIESALKVAQHNYDEAVLCAPIAGLVTNIKARYKGQVVARGEKLVTIVPATATLVVEANLPHKDMGFVVKGQKVKLKFDAFPFQDYGYVPGIVAEIEQHARDDSAAGSFYRVIIVPERTWVFARGQKIPFSSGMAVTAEIVTRQKSVLDYFLEPIKKIQDTRWS